MNWCKSSAKKNRPMMYVGFLEVEFEPRNKKEIKLKRLILKKNGLKTEKCWEEQIPEQFRSYCKEILYALLFILRAMQRHYSDISRKHVCHAA